MKKQKPLLWLALQTISKDEVALKIGRGRELIAQRSWNGPVASEDHLRLLDQFLRSQEIALQHLDFLAVVTGPGSFTSVRIGVAIANALSLACSVPLIAIHASEWEQCEKSLGRRRPRWKKMFQPLQPIYSKPPNITLKKS